MRTTIDMAGRLVVPKQLRDALGIRPGQELELSAREGRLEIEVPPTPMRLEGAGESVFAVPEGELPPLSSEEVRATLEEVRR